LTAYELIVSFDEPVSNFERDVCGQVTEGTTYYSYESKANATEFEYITISETNLDSHKVSMSLGIGGIPTEACLVEGCEAPCTLSWSCPNSTIYFAITGDEGAYYTINTTKRAAPVVGLENAVPQLTDTSNYYYFETSKKVIFGLSGASRNDRLFLRKNAIPGPHCVDYECEGNCHIVINNENATTFYAYVGSNLLLVAMTLEDDTIQTITSETSVFGQLSQPSGAQIYKFTLTQDVLQTLKDIEVSIFGVNQGEIVAWINEGQWGSSDSAILTLNEFQGSSHGQIPRCHLHATDYYLTLLITNQKDKCVPVTYGVLLHYNEFGTQVTPLQKGESKEDKIYADEYKLYSYTVDDASELSVLSAYVTDVSNGE
jgi:hypothetical protein